MGALGGIALEVSSMRGKPGMAALDTDGNLPDRAEPFVIEMRAGETAAGTKTVSFHHVGRWPTG